MTKRTTIGLDLPTSEQRRIEAWFRLSGLASHREQVEHITRIGRIVKELYDYKIPSDTDVENALYELGICFVVGDLRIPLPELGDGDDFDEKWRKAMGMSRARFDRHLHGIGLLVYEMMDSRPLEIEPLLHVLNEIGTRLLRANARDPRKLAEAFKRWREIERSRTHQAHMRQVVSKR